MTPPAAVIATLGLAGEDFFGDLIGDLRNRLVGEILTES
jgi:hypothetical protein